MNEILRIHLAGVPYEIDIAAKKDLEKYLIAIKKSLGDEADAMEDIEIRMTEILSARGVTRDHVITEHDLKAIKEQLGEPQDFSSTNSSDAKHEKESVASKVNQIFTDKRYYRDTDNAMIGGVLSGFAAYTGWDVTLLRLLLVALAFFTAGFAIILYIVVWICAPEASTTSEKLEMRGEPVNIDSIKQSAKKFSEQAEKTTKNVATKVSKSAQEASHAVVAAKPHVASAGRTLARILGVFAGIIGLIVSLACVFALVVTSNQIFFSIVQGDIVARTLLIVAVSFVVATVALIIIIGVVISIALLIGSFGKGVKITLITATIITILLMIAAASVSGAWFSTAGRDGAYQFRDAIHDRAIRIDPNSDWCIGICR